MPITRTLRPAASREDDAKVDVDGPTVPAPPPAEMIPPKDGIERGTVVGRYVVLDLLGEGGMGTVFAAHDATLDRQVALKIVRSEHATPGSEARLLDEAKAMARASHPAIVAVHDVGTVRGRVFVAMELVRGVTLRAWLADKPPLREIVRRFVDAGRGLEAAHAAGVVHGDFKPENVLVDAAGRVRVTDFGLARVVAAGGGEEGAAIVGGTPYFMAPEQHAGGPIDGRADQFSYCVALWLAVTGSHPFIDSTERRVDTLVDAVRAGALRPPPEPAPPRWLMQLLRKGLAANPADRFPTMTPLLAAIEEQLGRKRRRTIITGSVLILLGIVLGSAVMYRAPKDHLACAEAGDPVGAVMTTARRAGLIAALGRSAGLTMHELDAYAARWHDARIETCRATEVGLQSGELLDLRMACLDRRLTELDALTSVLATGEPVVTDNALLAVRSMVPLATCSDVVALREVIPQPTDLAVRLRVGSVHTDLARVKADFDTGRYARGFAAVAPARDEATAIGYRPLIAEAEYLYGALAWRADHLDVAEAALYRAIAAGEAGRASTVTAQAWLELVWVVGQESKRVDEARRLGLLAQGAVERSGASIGMRGQLEERLGLNALDRHDLDDAERHLKRALELRRADTGERDPSYAASLQHLALLAWERGDHDGAIALERKALAILESVQGPDHPDTLTLLNTLAVGLAQSGQLDEAITLTRRGLASIERTMGTSTSDGAVASHNLGRMLTERGRHDEAIAAQQRALAIYEKVRGPDTQDVADQRYELARAYREAGRVASALASFEAALGPTERAYGGDSEDVAGVLAEIGRARLALGKPADAVAPFERAVSIFARGKDADALAKARADLARARTSSPR